MTQPRQLAWQNRHNVGHACCNRGKHPVPDICRAIRPPLCRILIGGGRPTTLRSENQIAPQCVMLTCRCATPLWSSPEARHLRTSVALGACRGPACCERRMPRSPGRRRCREPPTSTSRWPCGCRLDGSTSIGVANATRLMPSGLVPAAGWRHTCALPSRPLAPRPLRCQRAAERPGLQDDG